MPPVALPRRMWAGGRFSFHQPVLIGQALTKTSTVTSVDLKQGRTGPLCFVTVQHVFTANGEVCITEDQDIVYRDHTDPDAAPPTPETAAVAADFSRIITPSETLLFRYSALTFNAHRIHYDRAYARDVEGYEGLVVHGPLTATLMADMVTAETGSRLAGFSFRGLAPLFDTAPFTISGTRNGDTVDLWATTPTGAVAMRGHAELR